MEKHPSESISIEVVYPLPQEQILWQVQVAPNTTVREAIQASGVLNRYSELELEKLSVGIFGKVTQLDTVVRVKDRIEIYRPLLADPKEVRKRRAAEGKQMKKGSGGEEK